MVVGPQNNYSRNLVQLQGQSDETSWSVSACLLRCHKQRVEVFAEEVVRVKRMSSECSRGFDFYLNTETEQGVLKIHD